MIIPGEYVVFDLETTGLSPKYAEIIEIGAIRVKNGDVVSRFQTYVKPSVRIPYQITQLTGISDDTVKNAPSIETAMRSFLEYIGNDVLFAHNSAFDMRFVCTVCMMMGVTLNNTVLDSLKLARKRIVGLSSYNLENLKRYLGINIPSHNALDDCTVTFRVIEKCRESDDGCDSSVAL